MLRNILYFCGLIIASVIFFFLGKHYVSGISPLPSDIKTIRLGQEGLINPLLEYEISSNLFGPDLVTFDNDIRKLTDKMISDGRADTISVYFRSLNNGPWFGIKENTNFFPASLLKVPVMVAYYKKAETDPTILTRKIDYDRVTFDALGNFNNGEYYLAKNPIEVGKSYTVEDLIERMIEQSDNNAKNLLVLNLDSPDELFKIYTDLGFATPPELRTGGDVLSVHEYASFYRILYNASYLDKEYSEKALEILSKTDFNRGISGTLPSGIDIAHKFGEYSDGGIRQLHDCGIVYFPKNPFILCIMTRGSDYSKLEGVIGEISKAVYSRVDKQNN